jgi:hypothetical protein
MECIPGVGPFEHLLKKFRSGTFYIQSRKNRVFLWAFTKKVVLHTFVHRFDLTLENGFIVLRELAGALQHQGTPE